MECLICRSPTKEYNDIKLDIKTYKCNTCKYLFKDPETFWELEEQKKRYDLHQNNPEDAGYRSYFQNFLDFVFSIIDIPKSVLDFGCGESELLADMICEMGASAVGYDPIYRPQKEYKLQRYDLITSVEVFEHLHNPSKVFNHLISLLDEGGVLAIRTEFLPEEMSDYFRWYYRLDPTHVGFFSIDTFRYLAKSGGCEYLGDNEKNIVLIRA